LRRAARRRWRCSLKGWIDHILTGL
jgi:hypothetical protein